MPGREPTPVSDDGHYVTFAGRRQRGRDPAIPEALRAELVAELMAARHDARDASSTAGPRVHDAEVALGEAGEQWWEPTAAGQRVRLAATMRALLRHRRPDATICPSDAARVVGGPSWRELMDAARSVAGELSRAGVVVVRQHGVDIDIATAEGPVRIARGPNW
jgi:Protein of unknown function (DUF3253)